MKKLINTTIKKILRLPLTFLNYSKAFTRHYIPNHIISRIPFYGIRNFYYKLILGVKLGEGSSIHMGAFFVEGKLSMGLNSVINRNCHLDCRGSIFVGDNVSISPDCSLITASHVVNSSDFKYIEGRIIINNYVWIGTRAMILPNVELGEGAVVCAGAVVSKDVPPYTVVGGVPAREISKRSKDLNYSCNYLIPFD